jgi:hypothetical protein
MPFTCHLPRDLLTLHSLASSFIESHRAKYRFLSYMRLIHACI